MYAVEGDAWRSPIFLEARLRPSLVNFVVVGAQKAGTTALFDYLQDDPAYALSDVKEVHFFDDETNDWNAPDYATYHARFDWSDPALIRGEATPIYMYWPRSLERLVAYNPAAKIIVMLRDPVERAWSHWRMETSRGVETASFSWCIREGRSRLFQSQPWGVHREYSYVERGFYGEQMERLLALFSRRQVLILTADALRTEPGPTLCEVNRFLGAAPPGTVQHRDVHVGRDVGSTLTEEDTAYLRHIYAPDQDRLEALTGIRFG